MRWIALVCLCACTPGGEGETPAIPIATATATNDEPPPPAPAPKTFGACFEPREVAKLQIINADAGDIDGDGNLDVMGGQGTAKFAMAFGENGGFTEPVKVKGPPGSFALSLGDVNGDERADALISVQRPGSIHIRISEGRTFRTGRVLPLRGRASAMPAVGDIDGDGNADLVVTTERHVQVYRGDGAGCFTPTAAQGAGMWPQKPTIADMDGDGQPDVLVASNDSHFLGVYKNIGGTIAAGERYPCGKGGSRVVTGDWDADGILDVAMTNGNSHTTCIFRGTGGGALALVSERAGFLGIASHDFDADGRHELIVGGRGAVDVIGFTGDVIQKPLRSLSVPNARHIFVTDHDHDGHEDLLLITARNVTVAFGKSCP